MNKSSDKTNRLFLVPTEFELGFLDELQIADAHVELCGFGLIASAANTSRLIAEHRPDRVVLCGIAGGLTNSVMIGSAYQFQRVGLFGIGVGHGNQHLPAESLGWKQWNQGGIEIGTELQLSNDNKGSWEVRDLLVSCTSASANPDDADCLREAFPGSVAEEMEGFAVAAACALASVPCQIIRGISNVAGDRDHSNWKVSEAMKSVSEIIRQIVKQTI